MVMSKKRKPVKTAARSTWPAILRAIRERHDLTQVEAAERIGVSASTWIAWENAQRVPGRLAFRLLETTFPDEF